MSRLLFVLMTLSVPGALPALAEPPPAADKLSPALRRQLLEERNQYRQESNRHFAAGRLAEAIGAAEKAAEIDRKVFGEASAERVDTLAGIAHMQEMRSSWPAARQVWKEIIALQTRLHGPRDWRTTDARLAAAALETMSQMTPEQLRQVRALSQRSNLADDLRASGRSREAAAVVRPLARQWEELLGKNDRSPARALHLQGRILFALRDWPAAETCFREARRRRLDVLGKNHPDVAMSTYELGRVRDQLNDSAGASRLFDEAAAIYQRTMSGHPYEAMALLAAGTAYEEAGDRARGRQRTAASLEIMKKAFPAGHPFTARGLFNLGTMLDKDGELDEAQKCYEEALAMLKKLPPAHRADLAPITRQYGRLLLVRQRYAEAQAAYEEAVRIGRQRGLPDDTDLARALGGLGHARAALRDASGARPFLEEAVKILRRAYPNGDPDLVDQLTNLGNVLQDVGEYRAARRCAEEALTLREKLQGADNADTAIALHNLGNLLSDLGEHAAAQKYCRRAVLIYQSLPPSFRPKLAEAQYALAAAYDQGGNHKAARQWHERAVSTFRSLYPKGHPHLARALIALGSSALVFEGEHGAARKAFEEAHAMYLAHLPPDAAERAEALRKIGFLHNMEADWPAAEKAFREALTMLRRARDTRPMDLAFTHTGLGEALFCSGKLEEAWEHEQEAIRLHRERLARLAAAQGEAEQLTALQQHFAALNLHLSVAAAAGALADCYKDLLVWKGAVAARQRFLRLARNTTDPPIAANLRQLQQVNAELLALTADRFGRLDEQRPSPDTLQRLEEQRRQLELRLSEQSAELRASQERSRGDVEPLRKALGDAVLIDCFEYVHFSRPAKRGEQPGEESRLLAFIVRANREAPTVVSLGPVAPVEAAIKSWRAGYGVGKVSPTDRPDPGAELRERLWAPLEKHLAGARTVLISPAGPLHLLPWAALPGKEPGKLLLHDYAMAVVPVPQLLPELLQPRPRPARPTLLAVGAVDFDAPDGPPPSDLVGRLSKLPGTAEEVRAVADLFRTTYPDGVATVLTGRAATKSAFVAGSPNRAHLLAATHGIFPVVEGVQPHQPRPGSQSGLMFAGANRSAAGGTASLTALEVADLDLRRVDLAVFSACGSGLGAAQSVEGVLGFQRALQVAGARTSVTTLWQVDDAATQALVTRFHRNLWERKLPHAKALQEAQLWLIQEGRRHPELLRSSRAGLRRIAPAWKPGDPPSPYYWAAFVLSGDWR